MRYLLFLISFFFTKPIVAQYFSQEKFKKADSIAIAVSKSKTTNFKKLVYELKSDLTDEVEIYRSFFKWVTLNIEYGGNSYYNQRTVLTSKKTKCEGYAKLLIDMCNEIGIEATYYSGLAKLFTDIKKSKKERPRHGWLAVKLNNDWYFSEPTWATSINHINYNKSTFIKNDEYPSYFLCKPELFIYDHFPLDPRDQKLNKKVSFRKFQELPILMEYTQKYHEYFVKIPKRVFYFKTMNVVLNTKLDDLHLSTYRHKDINTSPVIHYPVKIKELKNGNYKYKFRFKLFNDGGRGVARMLYNGDEGIFGFVMGM